jgi:hypothetical protein
MYMGWVSVMGTMNMGVFPAWRLLFLLFLPPAPPPPLGLPLGLPGMGWKSEKMAFLSGWQGLLAVEEATEWFWGAWVSGRGYEGEVVVAWTYLGNEVEGNHVSRLGRDRVGSELELVVRCNSNHHSGSRSGHSLGKPGSEDSREQHIVRFAVIEIKLSKVSEWLRSRRLGRELQAKY